MLLIVRAPLLGFRAFRAGTVNGALASFLEGGPLGGCIRRPTGGPMGRRTWRLRHDPGRAAESPAEPEPTGMGWRMAEHAVVVAGGGPTGLMLAGELALARVDVAIVERRASQDLIGSRAGGLHSR